MKNTKGFHSSIEAIKASLHHVSQRTHIIIAITNVCTSISSSLVLPILHSIMLFNQIVVNFIRRLFFIRGAMDCTHFLRLFHMLIIPNLWCPFEKRKFLLIFINNTLLWSSENVVKHELLNKEPSLHYIGKYGIEYSHKDISIYFSLIRIPISKKGKSMNHWFVRKCC